MGTALLAAVAVMDRLRRPGGCPWDAAQTHHSLAPHLVEETYEALDAIAADDAVALREELGDVLLQVLFHARLASERAEDGFDIDDVASDLVAKLTRRHPHVFGGSVVGGVEQVEADWERLKHAEKQRDSVTDGIPVAQPALALTAALLRRASRRPELGDVHPAGNPHPAGTGDGPVEQIGAELFALAARAAATGVDPEQALRSYAMRYRAALRAAEERRPPGAAGPRVTPASIGSPVAAEPFRED